MAHLDARVLVLLFAVTRFTLFLHLKKRKDRYLRFPAFLVRLLSEKDLFQLTIITI